MAYTAPTQRTTGTLITSSIYNTDIIDNITFFGVTHDHNGDSGDGGTIVAIPSNLIAHTTATTAPTGWVEYTAGRGRVIVGTPAAGTNGGTVGSALTDLQNPTHTHTGPSHTHETVIRQNNWVNASSFGFGGSSGLADPITTTSNNQSYSYSLTNTGGTGATGATSAMTPYMQLLGIQKG